VKKMDNSADTNRQEQYIKISPNGPYLVSGNVPLYEMTIVSDSSGDAVEWRIDRKIPAPEKYSLCRCGLSGKKPFCDGTHGKKGFKGTETAGNEPYLQKAFMIDGPKLRLGDVRKLCAGARFCDLKGGIWKLTRQSDEPDAKKAACEQVANCPSGRLVAWEKDGKMLEPELEPSIGVVSDPHTGGNGPLFVRGGIPIQSSDGVEYEKRNRVTLCRCGASLNKPFCDAGHIGTGGSA
jgi:CDGSH-type Zn-finger protein